MTIITFNVQGMHCGGCAQSIERKLATTPGVMSSVVDFPSGTATITFDEHVTTANSLEKVVEALGFDVVYGMGAA